MSIVSCKKTFSLFVACSYVVFWVSLACVGLAMALKAPDCVIAFLKNLSAWTPSAVALVLFPRLVPGESRRGFLARNFLSRIRATDFLLSSLIALIVLAASAFLISVHGGIQFRDIPFIALGQVVPVAFLDLTAGPMGEELGWRGYALGYLRSRRSLLASAVILGLIWGFWHLPLWILSGYSGADLALYVALFLVAIVSLSVIIAWFYARGGNILIAMWIHFLFNFSLKIVAFDRLSLFACFAGGYFLVACAIAIFDRQAMLERHS